MARARLLKPGFFLNVGLAELSPLTRLLFAGLWTLADREGRLVDEPKKIKAQILPYDRCDCDAMLQRLCSDGYVSRYEVDGMHFIQIETFLKHQHPNIKEPASTIPARESICQEGASSPLNGSLKQKQKQKQKQKRATSSAVLDDSDYLATLKAKFSTVDTPFELRYKWLPYVEGKPPKDYGRSAINWLENAVKFNGPTGPPAPLPEELAAKEEEQRQEFIELYVKHYQYSRKEAENQWELSHGREPAAL